MLFVVSWLVPSLLFVSLLFVVRCSLFLSVGCCSLLVVVCCGWCISFVGVCGLLLVNKSLLSDMLLFAVAGRLPRIGCCVSYALCCC